MLQHLDGIKHDEDSILNELEVLKPLSDYSDCVSNVSLAVRRVVMTAWEWNGTGGFDASQREPLVPYVILKHILSTEYIQILSCFKPF